MNTRRSGWITGLGLGIVTLASVTSAVALEVADLAGTWNIINFSMPSRLTLDRDANGVVTHIREATHFERSTGRITIQSNGLFSGDAPEPVNGTVTLGGQGEVQFTVADPEGPQVLTFHVNEAADVLATCGSLGEDFNDLILALRAPAALTGADIAGAWNGTSFQTPQQLLLERNASNQVINVQGLSSYQVSGGTLTLETNGTLGGIFEQPFDGTYTLGADGEVQFEIIGEEESISLTFFVNASGDTLAGLQGAFGGEDNFQELILFQRAPAAVTTAGLAGRWRVVAYEAPHLQQQKNPQGQLLGFDQFGDSRAVRQRVVAGDDGFFIAFTEGIATGTLGSAGNGLVNVAVNDSGEGAESIQFHVNAGLSVMTSARSDSQDQELLLLTKSPAAPGPALDFGLVIVAQTNGLTFAWAAATNAGLQVSSDLADWETLTNTIGQHTHSEATTNAATRFYRVQQFVP